LTHPRDLPTPPPPPIADAQRSKVFAAEVAARGRFARRPLHWDEVRSTAAIAAAAAGIAAPPIDPCGDGLEVSGGVLRIGAGRRYQPDVIHGVAHMAVDPVFPAHGAEFAAVLISAAAGLNAGAAGTLRNALDGLGAHRTPEQRADRVVRTATYVRGKEQGAIVRLVTDDPPAETLCQLLEVTPDGLLVFDGRAEALRPRETLRYLSYSFTASGRSRT